MCFDCIGKESSMNSRMETLFNMFVLQRKHITSGVPNELMECNYETGYKTLEVERKATEVSEKSLISPE